MVATATTSTVGEWQVCYDELRFDSGIKHYKIHHWVGSGLLRLQDSSTITEPVSSQPDMQLLIGADTWYRTAVHLGFCGSFKNTTSHAYVKIVMVRASRGSATHVADCVSGLDCLSRCRRQSSCCRPAILRLHATLDVLSITAETRCRTSPPSRPTRTALSTRL